ncbi:MAG: asparagine synthase (glutamine-hydrolyzing) [Planctomycetia bacterium]|nr:asparagine synthase (glutamine-hydrolyzing) [Planctomycetia bacterium]
MCGIAGIVDFQGPVNPERVGRMLDRIRHRGPDGDGIYLDRGAVLGHVRLSIIDVGGGGQPMHNEDKTLWITFNGEIFNYVELMADLKQRGHVFGSRCDTEVILHAYEEYGEDCVRLFNGQWSFAIWDVRNRKLFASRDRLGVRPFFYTQAGSQFLFASEIKALFENSDVSRQIDPVALAQLFTLWTTIPPRTMFQGVQELPPGHSLTLADGNLKIARHWSPDYQAEPTARSEQDFAEQLHELLVDATRLRLRSDVPVGAYLSGGLDSSLTSALVRRFTDSSLTTYSVAFDDPEFDESRFQADVTRQLGVRNQTIRCAYSDIGTVFPNVVWHAEKPMLRTAPAPLYLLSRLVKNDDCKVVVTGEGADEVLGGYDLFKEAKIRRFWARQPGSKFRPLLLNRLYPYLPNLRAQSDAYRHAFFHIREEDRTDPLFSHLPRWDTASKLQLFFSEAVRESVAGYDPCDEVRSLLPADFTRWDGFCQAQYLEKAHLLPGYILSSQGDRMAMAHGVEGRFPFLDHRVVEFASKLPSRLKMRGLCEKHLLKRVAADFVPKTVLSRSKQPYRAPDSKSFFGDAARPLSFDYVEDVLSPQRIRSAGLFQPEAVSRLVQKLRSGKAGGTRDNMALVGVLSTQLLVDQFINGQFIDGNPVSEGNDRCNQSNSRSATSLTTTSCSAREQTV